MIDLHPFDRLCTRANNILVPELRPNCKCTLPAEVWPFRKSVSKTIFIAFVTINDVYMRTPAQGGQA